MRLAAALLLGWLGCLQDLLLLLLLMMMRLC
jgi:hypothetical protein